MKKAFFDYLSTGEQSDFENFLAQLPLKDRVKVLEMIHKTETYGLEVAIKMKWVKKISKNLYELRSKVSNNIQRAIYFHVIGDYYMITHGFTKKTQKTPRSEIERGERLRMKYLEEENEN
ncbi:MAG: type II toxin-antitoxin system RelE/ParE family toxin [Streptococcaceae bacterium]|jgi:phage-related protein|nr:type II toxin-antitoxin system RelE/ParE family toxin [Streptococcaceae bacterium]